MQWARIHTMIGLNDRQLFLKANTCVSLQIGSLFDLANMPLLSISCQFNVIDDNIHKLQRHVYNFTPERAVDGAPSRIPTLKCLIPIMPKLHPWGMTQAKDRTSRSLCFISFICENTHKFRYKKSLKLTFNDV